MTSLKSTVWGKNATEIEKKKAPDIENVWPKNVLSSFMYTKCLRSIFVF